MDNVELVKQEYQYFAKIPENKDMCWWKVILMPYNSYTEELYGVGKKEVLVRRQILNQA